MVTLTSLAINANCSSKLLRALTSSAVDVETGKNRSEAKRASGKGTGRFF